MINGKGRLQRLNRAVRGPGNSRDDWEILRDLLQALGGGNGIYSIDDVFRQMSESIPQFAGLSLSKIGDLGVHVMECERITGRPSIRLEPSTEEAESKKPAGRKARSRWTLFFIVDLGHQNHRDHFRGDSADGFVRGLRGTPC